MIYIEPINAFNDNYIWCLYDDVSKQAVVVDPGDANSVEAALKTRQVALVAILITHHHPDHTGGINELVAAYDVPVYGPDSPNIPQITTTVNEPATLSLLDLDFDILNIPGHTLDHIAFYCAIADVGPFVFCGDTLFAGGCGRMFEGNPAMMLNSLNKLAALPGTTKIYCAHEYTLSNLAFAKAVEPTNLKLQKRFNTDSERRRNNQPTLPSILATELQTNPFLRCMEEAVIASATAFSGTNTSDPVEVFAAIRQWKDNF